MDLLLSEKYFLITGAGSGFGRAIAERLLEEGANIIVNSRTERKLIDLQNIAPKKVQYVCGNIAEDRIQDQLLNMVSSHILTGAVINAGGPAAKSVLETEMRDWDEAYHLVMRWKIKLMQQLIPHFLPHNYGRVIFIESISVKQPVENLVLSNAFRMAMVGYVKTLSQEVGHRGINLNVMAPGYHDTHAMQRIIAKKSETKGLSMQEVLRHIEGETMMGRMGDPRDFASLALWLLSPYSQYITGQTISVDGGLTKGVFG